jgi:hypothetical protein
MSASFPIVGRVTIASAPVGYSCTIQPSAPGSLPTFSESILASVYSGAIAASGSLDPRFSRLASFVTSSNPPTAIAPALIDAVVAALLGYACVVSGIPMAGSTADQQDVLLDANGSLAAAAEIPGVVVGQPAINVPGLVVPG